MAAMRTKKTKSLARKAWIAVLSFALFLFVGLCILDVACVSLKIIGPEGWGALPVLGAATWTCYQALRNRIDKRVG